MKKRNLNRMNGRLLTLWILGIALLAVAALGYIWQQREIHALGREMKKLEVELEDLRLHNERLSRRHAEMLTRGALERRVKELNLGLVEPSPSQMIRMTEPLDQAKEWAAREPRDRSN